MVPNKIFQGIAAKRPVITQDCSAIREFFEDGEGVLLVPPGNSDALSKAIVHLCQSPALAEQIVQTGYKRFSQFYSTPVIGKTIYHILRETLKK